MSQSVGELFINLGIKGTEKTIGSLQNVTVGMGDLKSMSLEAKAGIIGALYALEQFGHTSLVLGTNLSNTSTLIGVSTKKLQEYDYAAQQANVSQQEMEQTLKSLQALAKNVNLGHGIPEWLGRFAQVMGKPVNAELFKSYALDPTKAVQDLQKYAALEKDTAFKNLVLSSFNIGDAMKVALDKQVFNAKNFAAAPVLSDAQIKNLNETNIGIKNLISALDKMAADLTAAFGPNLLKTLELLVTDLDILIKLMTPFVEALSKLLPTKGKLGNQGVDSGLSFDGGGGLIIPKGYTPEGDIHINQYFYGNNLNREEVKKGGYDAAKELQKYPRQKFGQGRQVGQ